MYAFVWMYVHVCNSMVCSANPTWTEKRSCHPVKCLHTSMHTYTHTYIHTCSSMVCGKPHVDGEEIMSYKVTARNRLGSASTSVSLQVSMCVLVCMYMCLFVDMCIIKQAWLRFNDVSL